MAGRTAGKVSVPVKTFVAVIMKHHKRGGNQSSAARAMGVTPAAVSLRLKYLRSLGLKIPKGKTRSATIKQRIKSEAMAELKRWK